MGALVKVSKKHHFMIQHRSRDFKRRCVGEWWGERGAKEKKGRGEGGRQSITNSTRPQPTAHPRHLQSGFGDDRRHMRIQLRPCCISGAGIHWSNSTYPSCWLWIPTDHWKNIKSCPWCWPLQDRRVSKPGCEINHEQMPTDKALTNEQPGSYNGINQRGWMWLVYMLLTLWYCDCEPGSNVCSTLN